MLGVRAFFLGLREVFTLSHAEARAKSLDDVERKHRARFLAAAHERARAARKLSSPIAAMVLLRDALRLALAARSLELSDLSSEVHATDLARVAELWEPSSTFALDDLPFAEAEAARVSFENCLAAAIGTASVRTITAVHALRVTRVLAVIVFLAWLIVPYVRTHYLVHDVALGKLVTSSPLRGESPTVDHAVDGKTRGTFDLATIDAEHAFVMVDLGSTYTLDRVRVVNRGDGWFDDILPVNLEISVDGAHFEQVAHQAEHFDTWTVPLAGRSARFVRLIKPERGYIAINELEVYAR